MSFVIIFSNHTDILLLIYSMDDRFCVSKYTQYHLIKFRNFIKIYNKILFFFYCYIVGNDIRNYYYYYSVFSIKNEYFKFHYTYKM